MKNSYLLIFAIIFSLIFLLFPNNSVTYISNLTQYIITEFDDQVLSFASIILILSIILAFSPLGKIKLGNEKVEFSFFAWISMLFAAGMGSGLIFWSVAEPIFHYSNPPKIIAAGTSSADTALALTHFHWGLHAWSLYAISGLAVAWIVFIMKRPLRISSSFTNKPDNSWLGVVDFIAILAIIFGLAGTLANTVSLVQEGSETLFGLSFKTSAFRVILLLVITVLFTISSLLGLKKGIKRLSQFNIIIMLILWLIVLYLGNISSVFNTFIDSTLIYLKLLPSLSFSTIDGSQEWSQNWSIIYLIWWIAWAPFVGPFIAKISRGRSVRQFLLATIIIPTLASMLWFSAFADLAFHSPIAQNIIDAVNQAYTKGLFTLFAQYKYGIVLSLGALILLITFVVSSADSAIYMTTIFTNNTSHKNKLAWTAVLFTISLALIYINDVDLNKKIAIAGAIPFSIILALQIIFMLYSFVKPSKK